MVGGGYGGGYGGGRTRSLLEPDSGCRHCLAMEPASFRLAFPLFLDLIRLLLRSLP